MSYKLVTAQFLAATSGTAYDPEKRAPPHVLGMNFLADGEPLADAGRVMSKAISDWSSTATDANVAMSELRDDLVDELGPSFALEVYGSPGSTPKSETYLAIVDKDGNEVGHFTIVWPKVNGQFVTLQQGTGSGAADFGMVACLLLVIQEAGAS